MDNIVGCGKSILDSVMGQLAVLGPAINCGGSFWNFDERSELSVLGPKLDKAHLLGESPWAKLRMQKATYYCPFEAVLGPKVGIRNLLLQRE